MSNPTGDIALIGLAVMGQNLILNMNDHGFTVVAYNRTTSKVDEFWPVRLRGLRFREPTRLPNWCPSSRRRGGS